MKKEVVSGRVVTVARLCTREKCSVRNVNMTISRAFLPPNLVKAAVEGHLPRGQVPEIIAQKSAQKRSVWRRAGNVRFAKTGWWWEQSDTNQSQPSNSLLTGNFTGNFAILGPQKPISLHETTVPQRLFTKFPTQNNRENILKNREFLSGNRESPESPARCVGTVIADGPRRDPSVPDSGTRLPPWVLDGKARIAACQARRTRSRAHHAREAKRTPHQNLSPAIQPLRSNPMNQGVL